MPSARRIARAWPLAQWDAMRYVVLALVIAICAAHAAPRHASARESRGWGFSSHRAHHGASDPRSSDPAPHRSRPAP
jgi:hypothetical protein